MTDAELSISDATLIARLRKADEYEPLGHDGWEAADRIEALSAEIDLRSVMMEQIEEAAAQSPWVPPEYAMNEIISDCCSFLREPRYPSPDVAALVEAVNILMDREAGEIDRQLAMKGARAALARVKGEIK